MARPAARGGGPPGGRPPPEPARRARLARLDSDGPGLPFMARRRLAGPGARWAWDPGPPGWRNTILRHPVLRRNIIYAIYIAYMQYVLRGWPKPGAGAAAGCAPPPDGGEPGLWAVLGGVRACGPCWAGPGPSGPWVDGFRPRSAVVTSLGRTDGRTDGRSDGRTDGRTDRRTDGQTDGRVPSPFGRGCKSVRDRSNYLKLDRTVPLVYLARAPGWGWW